jgi:N-dimethylarginine dimethylaminohydrolase
VLDVNRDLPDATFIDDTAMVLDEIAVPASTGTAARRGELAGIEAERRKD